MEVSRALSSGVGHGRLGLSSNLRDMSSWLEESSTAKDVALICRLGKPITGWSLYSGACYVAPAEALFGGYYRDILNVIAGTDMGGLTRVGSLAECVASAPTYYYDPDEPLLSPFQWDFSTFDETAYWDQYRKLYVHLTGNVDPSTSVVEALYGFFMGQRGLVQPTFIETELLPDGSFEQWTDPSTPALWTPYGTVARESSFVRKGSYSIRIPYTDTWLNFALGSFPVIPGATYRLSGYHSGYCCMQLVDSGYTQNLNSDGRSFTTGTDVIVMSETPQGEWRRFFYDFRVPSTWGTTARLYVRPYISPFPAYFDGLSIKRIVRFSYFEPRIASRSMPSVDTGSNDVYFGGKRTGVGSVQLINADGQVDRLMANFDHFNAEVQVLAGGVLQDGQEVPFEDWRGQFLGYVQGYESDDQKGTLRLQDSRVSFHAKLPLDTYDDTRHPNACRESWGKSRPYLFGAKNEIDPPRYDVEPTTRKYGRYEIADCTRAPNGIKAVSAVWAYPDKDAADARDVLRRRLLEVGPTIGGGALTAMPSPQIPAVSISSKVTINQDTDRWEWSGGNGAWGDVGAYSGYGVTDGDYFVQFTAPSDGQSNFMLGISKGNTDHNYTDIDFAWQVRMGTPDCKVYESGVSKYTGTVAAGDRFRVAVEGTAVKYYKNEVLVYTSLVTLSASSYPLGLDFAAYNPSGYVQSPRVWTPPAEYTTDLANGTLDVISDVQIVEVTNSKGCIVPFDVGGSLLEAGVWTGCYTPRVLCFMLGHFLTSTSGSAIHVGYSQSTNKFTVAAAGGTLNLKCKTNNVKDLSIWPLLGFATNADRSGALSYTSDNSILSDVDRQHIIRADAQGYKDTAAGRYTGLTQSLISCGADIAQLITERFLSKPYSLIDQESFVSARSRAPEPLGIYLGSVVSTKDVFDRLEWSNVANIVIGGDGRIFYHVYAGDVPASAPHLYDRDLIELLPVRTDVQEIFSSVTVYYDQNPATGKWASRTSRDDAATVRFRRPDSKPIETYLVNDNNAITLSARYLSLAQRPARRFKATAKSKLLDLEVGGKFRITRSRAYDPNGQLQGAAFRIVSISKAGQDGRQVADVVDDVVTLASYACVAACQTLCELQTQSACVIACQESCQLSTCQTGCQVACQGCGQTVCQDGCQVACETCGQSGHCQTVAENPCVTGCEVACETCGQSGHCQDTCQTSCQDCGESAGPCQSTCESSCQSCGQSGFCQDTCQTGCQTGCEVACEDSCQVFCETPRQRLAL